MTAMEHGLKLAGLDPNPRFLRDYGNHLSIKFVPDKEYRLNDGWEEGAMGVYIVEIKES
jgi:hypothetical protein